MLKIKKIYNLLDKELCNVLKLVSLIIYFFVDLQKNVKNVTFVAKLFQASSSDFNLILRFLINLSNFFKVLFKNSLHIRRYNWIKNVVMFNSFMAMVPIVQNQFIDLQRKSMYWFLYDRNHRHERVKYSLSHQMPYKHSTSKNALKLVSIFKFILTVLPFYLVFVKFVFSVFSNEL